MRLAKRFLWAAFFLPLLFIFAGNAFGVVVDDYTPEVTARVVRISHIRGDVQIRRVGDNGEKQDWERAALNLPIVEGDELATGPNTVVEIQLDSYKHIRLWDNAYLKFTTLRDEGVSVSLPQGTMSVRAYAFDKERSYFEIDAPETTVSLQKAGMYRIDAGDTRSGEIRVTATEEGEAKIYTSTSGFTLRNGRTSRVYIEGNYAGDYETTNVSRVTDEFDEWVLQRDAIIAKRLNEAYYDKYYDRDIYGAEDLNEHGEWIYTKKYGYVWKPYPNTTSRYANWSPYRYGQWRWVPYYGWTWVNDEPWGWATYHHGRWVWDDNNWVWCPYGYYRWRRSWWSPGVVRIVTWNGSTICWYPLGYDDYYDDYNSGYRRRRNIRVYNNTTIINNNTTIINNPAPTPNPSPTPPGMTPAQINEIRRRNATTPSFQRIPIEAVVAVNAEEFGRGTRAMRTLPAQTARQVLSQKQDENQTPPILPPFEEVKTKITKDILIENPRIDKQEEQVKTGATQRETGKSLDQRLEKERIFGNRQPIIVREPQTETPTKSDAEEPRRTGAVNRRPPLKQDETTPETRQTPGWNPQPNFPTRKTDDSDEPQQKSEERRPRTRQRDDNQTPPIYVPQPEAKPEPRQEEERRPRQPSFPQPRQEEPRREEPKYEEPRRQPEPRREEPRPQPQPKSEPKEDKPTPPIIQPGKNDKDN